MALIEIPVEERTEFGTSASRRLRRNGRIPAVVYGEGSEARAITIDSQVFVKNIAGKGGSQLFKFKCKAGDLNGMMSLIKGMQTEPRKDQILHIDFLSVHEGHKIHLTVPVELVGEAITVKQGLIILNQTLYDVEVECLPTQIPDSLKLDISELREGISFHASDLVLPEGAKLLTDPGTSVVTAISKKALEEQEARATAAAAPVTPVETPSPEGGSTPA